MKTGTYLLLAMMPGLLLPQTARAEGRACGERTAIVERLVDRYGEERTSMGLVENTGILEVFASGDTGTWTILVSLPDGTACLIAAGMNWDNSPGLAIPSGQGV